MNILPRAHATLVPFLVCVTFVSPPSFAASPSTPTETAITWDSARLRRLEDEYTAVRGTDLERIFKRDGKSAFDERLRLIDSLFRKRLSERDLADLAATCDSLPVRVANRSPLANDLLGFIVRTAVDAGDRETLIALLSSRCPGLVQPFATIEFYLAWYGRTMKDPILILGQAYSAGAIPEVRHDIAAAVRRAFDPQGIQGADDDEFVANAMKWYEDERDGLMVEFAYCHVLYSRGLGDYARLAAVDSIPEAWLFRKRPASQRPPYSDAEFARGGDEAGKSRLGKDPNEVKYGRSSDTIAGLLDGRWDVVSIGDNVSKTTRRDIPWTQCLIRDGILTGGFVSKKYGQYRIRLPADPPGAIGFVHLSDRRWEGADADPLIKELVTLTRPGIYELKYGTLSICLAAPDAYRRPTSFDVPPGSGRTLIILRRPWRSWISWLLEWGTLTLVVAAAILYWPKWGFYHRWKRRRRKEKDRHAG